MLVLSRQRDETIMIGDDIELTIVDIRGDKVRVGISAPNSVSVHRKEVYEAIRKENEQAAAFRGDLHHPPSHLQHLVHRHVAFEVAAEGGHHAQSHHGQAVLLIHLDLVALHLFVLGVAAVGVVAHEGLGGRGRRPPRE